jgi:hypothetical protein
MSQLLINLIIQAIGGAIGGNAAGAAMKNLSLGTTGIRSSAQSAAAVKSCSC